MLKMTTSEVMETEGGTDRLKVVNRPTTDIMEESKDEQPQTVEGEGEEDFEIQLPTYDRLAFSQIKEDYYAGARKINIPATSQIF